jgi:TatD DNase family protein
LRRGAREPMITPLPAIDTHCHLDDPRFDGDRDAVVARAAAAGVAAIVLPAVRPVTWARSVAVARAAGAALALGVHPQVVGDLDDGERSQIGRTLAERLVSERAVAVGECGLDGASPDPDGQARLLRLQIAVARELRLPLLLHVLRAHHLAPRLLAEERAGEVGGILHSYSGGAELVPVYRDLGFAFSFAGPVTYAGSRRPLAAARAVPDELLLAETDAPDQAPEPHRGRRSEPAYVTHVIAGLARARGVAPERMAALTTANARRILALRDAAGGP